MISPKEHLPIYQQFIGFIKKGYAALNSEHQLEVRQFIQSCQHREGVFSDRAGNPDCYYSLFGTWLSMGTGLFGLGDNQNQDILCNDQNYKNEIDEFASLLIKISLAGGNLVRPSYFYLLKRLFLTKSSVSFFYRIFLFFLIDDALYRRKWMYAVAHGVLFFTSPPEGAPCSIQAAYLTGRYKSGLDIKRQQKELLDFFVEGKGFKTFREADEVDLLSTAVALYALQAAGTDLRLIAPDCLNFIQENYCEGAFLAGNDDNIRDLEYTFYGLLALGILV